MKTALLLTNSAETQRLFTDILGEKVTAKPVEVLD